MGKSRNGRKAFFAEHPLCCFCGGATPATTEDHVPSRIFFINRAWSEGFNFRARQQCNQATANIEQLAAMVCRIGKVDPTEEERRHSVALMQGVNKNSPGLLETMRQGANARFSASRSCSLCR